MYRSISLVLSLQFQVALHSPPAASHPQINSRRYHDLGIDCLVLSLDRPAVCFVTVEEVWSPKDAVRTHQEYLLLPRYGVLSRHMHLVLSDHVPSTWKKHSGVGYTA